VVRSTHGHVPLHFAEADVADPHVPPAYVSDPEDHVTGSYGRSLSASADLRTQEIQGTLD